jgi:hypothetical protein
VTTGWRELASTRGNVRTEGGRLSSIR